MLTLPITIPTHPDLAGAVAVVTGASHGVGAATVRALVHQGARVAAIAEDATGLRALAGELGQDCLPSPTDCTDAAALNSTARQVRDEYGPASLVFAFADGDGAALSPGAETPDQWRAVLESELTTTFLTVRAFLPDLLETRGAVVTMAAASGHRTNGASAAHAAAKAGVAGLTRHLAEEHAARGLRVNCVAPANSTAEEPGPAEEVVAAALFLASAASAGMTGATLDVTGHHPARL